MLQEVSRLIQKHHNVENVSNHVRPGRSVKLSNTVKPCLSSKKMSEKKLIKVHLWADSHGHTLDNKIMENKSDVSVEGYTKPGGTSEDVLALEL